MVRFSVLGSLSLAIGLLLAGFAAAAPTPDAADLATPLSADGLVEWVLESNPGLAADEAAAAAAAYRVDAAGVLDDPTIRYRVAPDTIGDGRGARQWVQFAQTVPWPGTLSARRDVARHRARTQAASVEEKRLQLVAAAKKAHAEWWFVQLALQVNDRTRSLLDELLATARSRYVAGRAQQQEVLRADAKLVELNVERLRLAAEQLALQARINAMLNRNPEQALPDAGPPRLQRELPDPTVLAEAALSQHPELRRFGAQLAGRRSEVKLAEKDFLPNFSLGVGYNSLLDDVDRRPTLGVILNIPLNRSRRRANLSSARAEVSSAELALLDRRSELLAGVTATSARVAQTADTAKLIEDDYMPLARSLLQASLADYRSGTDGFLNVISAQQALLEVQLRLARTRADHARHVAELERWVGTALAVEFSQTEKNR